MSATSSLTGCSPSGISGQVGSSRSGWTALATMSSSRSGGCAEYRVSGTAPSPRSSPDYRGGDAHFAGRLAARRGRRDARRAAAAAPRPGRAAAGRPHRAGHPGRDPGLGAPGLRRPRHRHARRARGAGRRRRRQRAGRRSAELRRLLGPDVPAAVVDRALAALRERAPGLGDGDALALVPAARDVVPRYPGGLGRPATGPAGSSALPRAARRRRRRRAPGARRAGRRPADRAQPGRAPTRRARSGGCSPAGCCCGSTPTPSSCPGRSALALRGDRPLGHARRRAARTSGPATAAPTSSTAPQAGRRSSVLRQVELLVAFWARHAAAGAALRRARGARAAPGGQGDGRRRDRRPRCSSSWPWRPTWSPRPTASPPEWVPTTAARRVGGRRAGAALVAAGPRLARPAPAARAGRARRTTPAGRSPRCPTASAARWRPRDRRRVLAGLAELAARGGARLADRRWPTLLAWRAPRRGGRLRDEVVGWVLAEATVLGVVALDAISTPGPGAARRPGRADRGAARDAARAGRPRAAAGRPDRGRARPAGAGAGRRARTWWPRSSRPAGPPCTGSPRPPSGARSTPGAPPPSCTSCWPPARPPRCRRRCATWSTTWPAGTAGCAAARRRRSCAPTTRC